MFNSNVLEVGIGLAMTYLSVSLVVTATNELIAAVTRSRAHDLESGIANMLEGTSAYPEGWWRQIVRVLRRGPAPAAQPWTQAFFDHHLVKALSKDGERPSYIPSGVFASVLLHLAQRASAGAGAPSRPAAGTSDPVVHGQATFDDIGAMVGRIGNAAIREALLPLLESARADLTDRVTALDKASAHIEVWYDQTMDRVSGWYKRRTQRALLIVALVTVAAANVDTIAICQKLGRDDTLRATIVEAAKQYTTSDAARTTRTIPAATQPIKLALGELQQQIGSMNGLGFPIGWQSKDIDAESWTVAAILSKASGLLITAFAASLGAPFWFDVLNKFMSVRGAGKAPEETPKPPKAVLSPTNPQ